MDVIIIFWIILIILVLLITMFAQYNIIVKKKIAVEQSKSGIDIYLKQRFDLIPNLVEIVKGYSKHEKEVLEEITKLRAEYNQNQQLEAGAELNMKLNSLLAVVENYPQIKADEQFLNLQKTLIKIESQLQASRRIYNTDVKNYNTCISTIPYNIIANIFGFNAAAFFEIPEEEKENAEINV